MRNCIRRNSYQSLALRQFRSRARREGPIPGMRGPKPYRVEVHASELCFQAQRELCGLRKQKLCAVSSFSVTRDSGPFASPGARTGNLSDKDLQRAEGSGQIVVSGSATGTRVMRVFERAPIRVMFPKLGSGVVREAVLVNIAGGIAGGDRLEYVVTALARASMRVTSQAAEKVYRALSEPARIATKLKAFEGAKLAWLPQETILFNWARLSRETEIELSSGAELLALEWLVLGRAAHGEETVAGHITDSWRVKKDGRLIWADCFRVTHDTFTHLHRKALLSDCKALATLVYFGPFLEKRMELSRAITPSLACTCAATTVAGLMVVRFAAKVSADLRLSLHGFLQRFGQELGPGPFCVPKVWLC